MCFNKILKSIIILITMLLISLSMMAQGTPGLNYTLINNGTAYQVDMGTSKILGNLNITIPATFNGLPVTKIADYGFKKDYIIGDYLSLLSVAMPSSITIIGIEAFYDNTELTSAPISPNVIEIGRSAYAYTAITSAVIPEGVTGDLLGVFVGCYYLTTVTLPSTLTTLSHTFGSTWALTSIDLPSSLVTIGNSTFSGSGLTSLTIPSSVTTIGESAFASIKATEVFIPDTVTSMGDYVFRGCPNLYEVTINSPVMGNYTFYQSPVLELINIGPNLTTISNFAFSLCDSLVVVDIPGNITTIGENAFADCISLTIVNFSEGLHTIQNNAFKNCNILENITLPNSLINIGNDAFINCFVLESITIPNNVVSIGGGAFRNCRGLVEVSFGNSLQSIGFFAFSGCISLTGIFFPNSLLTIGHQAFFNCEALSFVSFGTNLQIIGGSAFDSCNLTEIDIPTSVSFIGSGAFYDNLIENVQFNNHNLTLESSVFRYNPLISLSIINSNIDFSNEAFQYSTHLQNVSMINSTINIGESAFRDCTSLVTLLLTESGVIIGKNAFIRNTSLTTIDLGNTIELNEGAFRNCSSLTSIYIPASVFNIPSNPFINCQNLQNIEVSEQNIVFSSIWNSIYKVFDHEIVTGLATTIFPENLNSIGPYAFFNVGIIGNIVLPAIVWKISEYAFASCTSLNNIFIPESVTMIGNSAFGGASSLTIYTQANSPSYTWHWNWNPSNRPVIWGWQGPSQLDPPYNLRVINNALQWNYVENALSYIANINGNLYDIYWNFPLNDILELGVNEIKIKALGDGMFYLDSEWSEIFVYNYGLVNLEAPTNLNIYDNLLMWDSIENSTQYLVDVDGNQHNTPHNFYSLSELTQSRTYILKVKALGDEVNYLDSDWSEPIEYTVVSDLDDTTSLKTALIGNYPNPFNPETTIIFALQTASQVTLEIYNIRGQRVKTLVDSHYDTGSHRVVWDGKDNSGTSVSSGIYFNRMTTGEFQATKRMLLIK